MAYGTIRCDYITTSSQTIDIDALGATDLSYTAATRVLASSSGTDATLPEVVASGDSGLMTGTDKAKLDGIAAGAEVNVNADWNAISGDAQILNKPTLGTAAATDSSAYATAAQGTTADSAVQPGDNISDLTNDSGFITSSDNITGNATTATTASTANALNTSNNYQVNSLGVGTAASGTAGEIRATNDITAYYSSDINLKKDVELIADPLEKLQQISGVSYSWNEEYLKDREVDGYFVREREIGVIAQEVEAVLPEIVATREDGYKAVRYERLVALLIEAVKAQQVQIDELKSRIGE